MKSLIIFAGAGASRGISNEKYPMALDFKNRLPDEIQNSHLYMQLIGYLEKSHDISNIDIEHILWELGQLNSNLTDWISNNQFSSNILQTNQISSITSHQHAGLATYSQFEALKSIVNNLQDKINEKVYDYYSQLPTPEELERSWQPLLEKVSNLGFDKIDIVTTNYDLIIESALFKGKYTNINTGYTEGLQPSIDLNAWRDDTKKSGLLTKLHGSVDWKLGNGGSEVDPIIRRGLMEFEGDHNKRLILYPGFKGEPNREPFITFHKYFRRQLQLASHILFIGFAFRDEFINQIINSSLPPKSKVAVINPANELPDINFLASAIHLKEAFGMSKRTSVLASGGLTPFSVEALNDWLN